MSSNTVVIRVGRLMEVSASDGFRTVEDVEHERARIAAVLDPLPKGQRVVIAADWRACQVMSQPAANALSQMLGNFNPRVERSALLASPTSPVAVLQFLRVVRESRHPARRVFEDRRSMMMWLGGCLSEPERERLAQFLVASAPEPRPISTSL